MLEIGMAKLDMVVREEVTFELRPEWQREVTKCEMTSWGEVF